MKSVYSFLLIAFYTILSFGILTKCTDLQQIDEPSFSSMDSIPFQKFIIDSKKDAVIKGLNGSSYLFPAGSLVDETGNQINGMVEIELKEINSIEDFVKSGITTESDGNLLISDGSYYINARQNGKNLKIGSDKSVYARFPTKAFDRDMQFFNGDTINGNVNWKLDTTQKTISRKTPTAVILNQELPKTSKAPKPSAPSLRISAAEKSVLIIEYNDLSMYLQDNLYNEETKYVKLGGWYIPEEEADRIVRSKYGVSFSEYKPFNNYDSIKTKKPASLWDEETKATPFKYRASVVEARERRFKEISKQIGADVPQIPIAAVKKEKSAVKPVKQENENWDDFTRREDEAYKKEFGTEAYIYALRNLGWVNCDKYNKGEIAKFEGFIKNANGEIILNNAEIHLVSRKEMIHLKCLTKDGKYSFNYIKNKPFDVLFVYNSEAVSKAFDGTKTSLEEINLTQP
jgi:hypothetical protein